MSVMASSDAGRAVLVVTVPGRFDASTVGLVRQALTAAINECSADVTIELSAEWVDMPALAVLAHAHRQLREQNRRMLIRCSSDSVRRVLAVTGLSRVIAVQPRVPHLVA